MVTSSFGVTHHLWHLGPLQVTWDFKLVQMFLNYDLLLLALAQWSVQSGPDGSIVFRIGSEGPRAVQSGPGGPGGPKWFTKIQNGPEWSRSVQVGPGWSEFPNRPKRRIGPKWRIGPNRSKWFLVKIKIETILEWALWVELTVWAHLQIEGDQLNRYYSLLFECSHL